MAGHDDVSHKEKKKHKERRSTTKMDRLAEAEQALTLAKSCDIDLPVTLRMLSILQKHSIVPLN